jgi:pilus assembly protein CpaE
VLHANLLLSHHATHPTPLKLGELLEGRPDSPMLVELERAESCLTQVCASRLVVVLSPLPERALQVMRKVRGLVGGPVLAVGPADSKLILRALNEGANHYLDEADLEGQLEAALARLATREDAQPARMGRLAAVLGASGGSGTSTVAANLAAALAREASAPGRPHCALIDLHPGAGDLAALLDLKPTHTLAELCTKASRMNQAMIEASLVHHPCGVSLLAPPTRYDEISLVTPHGVRKVLTLIRQLYPWTVVDLEDSFHEEQVTVLRQADHVLIVVRPDFTSLRNTRRLLEYLDQLGLPCRTAAGGLRLVLNRCGQAKELPSEEVEQVLQTSVAHFLPDDPRTVNPPTTPACPPSSRRLPPGCRRPSPEAARGLDPAVDRGRRGRSGGAKKNKSWLIFR